MTWPGADPPSSDPLSAQLSPLGYQLDLRPAASRPHVRQSPVRANEPLACVLLVSRSADAEARTLRRLLAAAGVPALRIDAETIAAAGLVIDLSGPAGPVLHCYGQAITPTVTLVRHFSGRAFAGRAPASRRMFAQDSWHALPGQLAQASAVTIGLATPGQLAQLECARVKGIAVPRTVITSDLAAAASKLSTDRVVVKALDSHFVEASPGRLTGVFPQLVSRAELTSASPAARQPVVVQEYVEHDQEIRAYYAAGDVVTFTVSKSYPAQPWLEPAAITVSQIPPPDGLAAATRTLASALSLHYGAFDFLVRAGQPVFLEVNATGDWCWAEQRADSRAVSEAVTRMLSGLHQPSAGSAAGSGQFALTSFLAAGDTR